MLARESVFKEKRPENLYSKHLPNKLYSYLNSIDLINKKEVSFEFENGKSTQFTIKEEKIEKSLFPNAVSISITNIFPVNESNNSDLNFLTIPENKTVNSATVYYFTNKNGLTSAYFDENGWDYPGDYNQEALLWSNNFLCKQKTSAFVDNIVSAIKKVAPEIATPAPESPSSCLLS